MNRQIEATSTPLSDAIERYLTFLQSEENKSPLTMKSYRESLALLTILFCGSAPKDFSKETVRTYKQNLHNYRTKSGKELSIRSKNHHITILRAFLRYLAQEEELKIYPPDCVKRFKEDQRKVKVLFTDELQRLFAEPNMAMRAGKRDRAILELFFSTGLRLAELCSLNRKDINFKTREISVRGKRGKVRVVFLSDGAVEYVRLYIDSRIDYLEPLFIGTIDRAANAMPPGEGFRLTSNSVYRLVKKYALAAGIVSDPSPHTLRHSFATDLLRNGADLRSVQELLGHKDLSTTQIYTHVTNPQLKEVHKKYHAAS